MIGKACLKDFDIIKQIGRGSYATVYKALYKQTRKDCALKIIKTEGMKKNQIESTLNEIRLLSSIDSPFIVSYKDAFIENKEIVIVMEYIAGGDLAQKIQEALKQRTLFPEELIWRYLCQILLGLQ